VILYATIYPALVAYFEDVHSAISQGTGSSSVTFWWIQGLARNLSPSNPALAKFMEPIPYVLKVCKA
jgi:hypothetical protein